MPWRPTPEAIRELVGSGGLWIRAPGGEERDATLQERLDWALREAASIGDADLVRDLLRQGADPQSDPIVPPLVAAAQTGEVGVMEALVEAGGNVNQGTEQGHTPLMEAATWGHAGAVRWLLARGADPRAKSADGETALSLSERVLRGEHRSLSGYPREPSEEIIALLRN